MYSSETFSAFLPAILQRPFWAAHTEAVLNPPFQELLQLPGQLLELQQKLGDNSSATKRLLLKQSNINWFTRSTWNQAFASRLYPDSLPVLNYAEIIRQFLAIPHISQHRKKNSFIQVLCWFLALFKHTEVKPSDPPQRTHLLSVMAEIKQHRAMSGGSRNKFRKTGCGILRGRAAW